jgi:dTDP-4-dehydrorhamnose 3,5-epimerase
MYEFIAVEGLRGVWTRSCQVHSDDRGYFLEALRKTSLPKEVPDFVQDSVSFSKKNVLRGMHLQHNQWQLVTLLSGQIQDVVFNLDEESIEYKRATSILLKWNAVNQVLISPGIAHGYAVLSEDAIIHYKSSIYYGDSPETGAHWKSKEIFELWPKQQWTVSIRDSNFGLV